MRRGEKGGEEEGRRRRRGRRSRRDAGGIQTGRRRDARRKRRRQGQKRAGVVGFGFIILAHIHQSFPLFYRLQIPDSSYILGFVFLYRAGALTVSRFAYHL